MSCWVGGWVVVACAVWVGGWVGGTSVEHIPRPTPPPHTHAARPPLSTPRPPAAVLGNTWLAPHFQQSGDRSTHFGPFTKPLPHARVGAPACVPGSGCC